MSKYSGQKAKKKIIQKMKCKIFIFLFIDEGGWRENFVCKKIIATFFYLLLCARKYNLNTGSYHIAVCVPVFCKEEVIVGTCDHINKTGDE